MKLLQNSAIICILFSMFSACQEVVDIELPSGYKRVVVEGWITDEPGPYVVKLTQTTDYSFSSSDTVIFEKGAQVIIKDDLGNVETLKEIKDGVYATDTNGIKGEIGRSYNLFIETKDNRRYQSDNELLMPIVPIDTFYYQLDYSVPNPIPQSQGKGPEATFYLKLSDPENEENFYMHQYSHHGRDGNTWGPVIEVMDDKFMNGKQITLDGSNGHFWGGYYYHFRVRQMSITKEAYKFWSLLFLQTEEVGGPYDTPPAPIFGNIHNLDDPKDYALGYFGASSVKNAEILIKE